MKTNKGLWGRVKIPTDGIVHDSPGTETDLVEFQNRRYSPDGKRRFYIFNAYVAIFGDH